jgi:hypothetical protein
VIGEALTSTGLDLFVGIVGGCLIFIAASVVGKRYERWAAEQEERRQVARAFRQADYAAELRGIERTRQPFRVIDKSRRGPERVCGPESRTDRLPFSGRRSA